MNDRDYILTQEGAQKIEAELEELRGPRRVELAKRLRHAIQQGDLKENADYAAAKEDQAFLEGRIQELEAIMRYATIVDEPQSKDRVEVGNTVIVVEGKNAEETFHLVGNKEADPRAGKISHESPIGKALIGKKVGDTTEAETPAGTLKFKILEIN